MMKIFIRYILLMCCLLVINSVNLAAQEPITVTGKVYKATTREPIRNVQVYSAAARISAITDSTGSFSLTVSTPEAWLRFSVAGYQENNIFLNGRNQLDVYLAEADMFMYNSVYNTAEGVKGIEEKISPSIYMENKDFGYGHAEPGSALAGRIAGLKVTSKSGMPGEGSLIQLRGLRSLYAENTPLIILDGMPYLPDLENSAVIKGYSRNIFAPINMKDVENITLLKGADAASYGSLGSNGVLLIQTERSKATETQVKLHFTEGVGFMKRRYPLLSVSDFKTYIADIGEGMYSDLNELVEVFPFLKDDPTYPGYYLYTANTNWQDEIYTPSVVSENNLKIMGGDEIASYALSVGYLYDKGVLKNTQQSKYNTRLNADVHVTKNFLLYANAVFNYGQYDLMETGLNYETNPILTALNQAPILSVYSQSRDGENLPTFNKTVGLFGISNPVAVINNVEAKNRTYDIVVDLGFKYDVLPSLKLNGILGIYYSYSKDNFFVPGLTSGAISFLTEGVEANTIRVGIGETLNYYLKLSADYHKTFNNIHQLSGTLGYQLISSRKEMDWSQGLSIQSDFYTSLSNVNSSYQRHIGGYNDKWNWIDVYLTAKYGYKGQYYVGATLTMDAASSYGKSTSRAKFLPAGQLSWVMKNSTFLQDVDMVDILTVRGEYGISANSRYSAKYGRYYYQTVPFRDVNGMIRMGLPNSKLGPEKVEYGNVGVDFVLLGNRLGLSVDLYQEKTKDMLVQKGMGVAYGYDYMYRNDGEMKTRGLDVAFNINLFSKTPFNWSLGGNVTRFKTTVESLGGVQERIYTLNNGAVLISRVGETPFSFYGHKMEKVFYSQREATAANYITYAGTAFEAGDIKFADINRDNIINDEDRVLLGSATPKFYGGFYSNMTYKKFNLFVNFAYSYGNKIYNAVRKNSESMSAISNQFSTVVNRWKIDGQETDMPRAAYGDPMGNARFSSRWIDDGSYLRMKEVTLSYTFGRKVWFFNDLQFYLTGENLLTWTKYIGIDPEMGYSYDPMLSGMDLGKVPNAKTAKLGVVLNF